MGQTNRTAGKDHYWDGVPPVGHRATGVHGGVSVSYDAEKDLGISINAEKS
jgi:hypothetical protein